MGAAKELAEELHYGNQCEAGKLLFRNSHLGNPTQANISHQTSTIYHIQGLRHSVCLHTRSGCMPTVNESAEPAVKKKRITIVYYPAA